MHKLIKLLTIYSVLITKDLLITSHYLNASDGHVPYFASLPFGIGPLFDFPVEWWYYAGYAKTENNTDVSILIMVTRFGTSDEVYSIVEYGIGYNEFYKGSSNLGTNFSFDKNYPVKNGITMSIPSLTNYYLLFEDNDTTVKCELTHGKIGVKNSLHTIYFKNNNILLNLTVNDQYGAIFEGHNGYIANNSIDFGFPKLSIIEGNIMMNNTENKIISGNMWLDRQALSDTYNSNYVLYTGNWIYLDFENNNKYLFRYLWLPKVKDWQDTQWIIGPNSNAPPIKSYGFDLSNDNVVDMKDNEYSINILYYKSPNKSPHWKSPTSNITYGSAWIIQIYNNSYIIETVYNNAEILTYPQSAFEGALIIKSMNDTYLGNGFIEQMYNHKNK